MTVEEKEKIETMHSGKKWQFSGHEKKVAPDGNRTQDLWFTGLTKYLT